MYTVAPAVTRIAQVTQYDCWHATLRMILKWRSGAGTEPTGTHTLWLYQQCRMAQNGFDAEKRRLLPVGEVSEIDDYRANSSARERVAAWAQGRTLVTNGRNYSPFSTRPGLTRALLPTLLAENGLRAVCGPSCIRPEMTRDLAGVEQMLRDHGPLYCLVDFGHVVAIVGTTADALEVLDPLGDAGVQQRGIASVTGSPCVARIA